jgi:hypothetical protein
MRHMSKVNGIDIPLKIRKSSILSMIVIKSKSSFKLHHMDWTIECLKHEYCILKNIQLIVLTFRFCRQKNLSGRMS